jgi:hypothetical protein
MVMNHQLCHSGWLVNYAKLHRASLHVGTSITDGTAKMAQRTSW